MPSEATQTQRALTIEFLTKRRLLAPAQYLKPESILPVEEGAVTDLEEWRNPADERNLGVGLVDGFIELHIKAPDDIWIQNLFKAFRSTLVDARAAYGSHRISSIILNIDGKIEPWRDRWPRGHRDKAGAWVQTAFAYSQPQGKVSKPIWAYSTPLPGSRFGGALVVWRPGGKPPADDIELGLEDLEARMLAPTSMESICRSIAFATLAYWINDYNEGLTHWEESFTRTIGGWIARIAREGADINARGKSLEGVCWSPIDDAFTASELIEFLTKHVNAPRELKSVFEYAEAALERGAPIPGWGAIETLFGPAAKVGIRRAFRAGLDIDAIEAMSDQYIYDRTAGEYLDRDELLKGLAFEHKHDALAERHNNESINVGKKALNPFKLYAMSSLRTDVQHREFRPGYEPGAILRYSPVHGLLGGDDRHPDEYRVLNTFPGFVIKPIATIDPDIMRRAVTMLDRVLALITQENDEQMMWLKKFTAHIAQYPQIKPQACPILIGGQGIGKSVYGQELQTALFSGMAGTAQASTMSEDKFLITPFIGKLIIFIDEVKLESVGAINIIKKLVRSQYISGQRKFKDQRDHYIPGRLMIASNSPDIGLTSADAVDRTFFFIMAWTAENKRMTDREFLDWTVTLKPFYAEFVAALESVVFKQHLMRYFMDLPVERAELEDLTHSSRNDVNVVRATMSKAREVARDIVADARVAQGNDIAAWFSTAMLREAIRRVDGSRTKVEASDVIMEFERAGVIETMRGDLRRFKYRYGKLLQKMGEAHNLPITNNWDYEPDDYGDNDVAGMNEAKPWRGNSQRQQKHHDGFRRRNDDPDAMDPY